MFHSRTIRSIVILIVVLVFASTAYALAAGNTFDANLGGKAGDGQEDVSGYEVSSVTYTLDTTNPSLIASVEFDLTPTGATNAAASLIDDLSNETFASGCLEGPDDHFTCSFPVSGAGTVAAGDAWTLRVIAVQ